MNFKWFLESNIEKKVIKKLPIHEKQKQILQRRVNKLKRDPKGFIEDSYVKRKNQVRKYLPIKYNGHFQYTVVSAVYNVEKYLDDYFKSLVNQSLNFKKHIQLILVDDGSTDNSAQIIKKWQKKYPNNIEYYYKKNGGQASARNLGLQYVQTEWVTFIDPDDFVDVDYFKIVDERLTKTADLVLISCPFIFYFEDLKAYKNTHPLKYRFSDKDHVLSLNNMGKNIQLSVNSAFFKKSMIDFSKVSFHEEVRPNFEDAKFVGEYLSGLSQDSRVAFIVGNSYFYRKRSDGSSTLDKAWRQPTLYGDVLSKGCLEMLENAKQNLGFVPVYLQRAVLYHLSWYFKYLINNDLALDILTDQQKQNFLDLLDQIFYFVDEKTIMEFELAGTWFFQRVTWLGYFKRQEPPFQIVYIENIDREKKQILVYYFSCQKPDAMFTLGDQYLLPAIQKTVRYDFVGKDLVYEHRYWISYGNNPKAMFDVFIGNQRARISLKGKQHKLGLPVRVLLRDFEVKSYESNPDIWVLMDRDTQADDNAEHLYRYIASHHPEKEIYFALNRTSHDWSRLEAEGFRMLDFGSSQFEKVLKRSGKLISSHLDEYINDYFGDNFEFSKKFVFLQHGITMNDLSSWVNSKKNLQLFISATPDEYQTICGQNTRYKTTKKEMVLTGFPRHDVLLQQNRDEKIVLIMPTWRKSVLGSVVGSGNKREINPNFISTQYAQSWQAFLQSTELKKISEKYGYAVVFSPHANIEPYLDVLDIPAYIQLWNAKDDSIQKLFQKSSMMITDYSSVHFEMGVLGKPVLYYQFDKDDFFRDGHIFQQGYFSYEKHGFGAVVYELQDLLKEIELLLKNNCVPLDPYATRIRDTFPFRDGKNCERVYQAIVALDEPDDGSVNAEILAQAVASARKHKVWHLIELRLLKQIELNLINELDLFNIQQEICQAMYMQGKYKGLLDYLPTTKLNTMQQKYWQVKLDFWLGNYQILQDYFIQNKATSIEDGILNLLACAYLHDQKGFDEQKQWLLEQILSSVELSMLNIAELVLQGQDFEVCTFVDSMLTDDELIWQLDEMRLYKPLLIGAKSAIVLREFDLCLKYIRAYEKKVSGDYASRLILAQQDFAKDSYKWATVHYEKLIEWGVDLPKIDYIHYIESLYYTKQDIKIENCSLDFELILANDNLLDMWMNYQSAKKNWQTILNVLDKFNDEQKQKFIYLIVLSYYRTGQVEKAYKICRQPELADSYEHWELIAELAVLMGDKELAKYCYRTMVAVFPERNKEASLRLLQNII